MEKQQAPRKEWIKSLFEKFFVPFLFHKVTQVFVFGVSLCLFTIGFMSCFKITRGLNQNLSLSENSAVYDYFLTLQDYGEAGPPAYLVFNNIDY